VYSPFVRQVLRRDVLTTRCCGAARLCWVNGRWRRASWN